MRLPFCQQENLGAQKGASGVKDSKQQTTCHNLTLHCPNLIHMLLMSIPTGCKFFTETDLCSTFLVYLLVKLANPFLSPLGKERWFICTAMSRGLLRALPISIRPWRRIRVVQSSLEVLLCCNMWVICFLALLFKPSLQKNNIHLLEILVLKGYKVAKNTCGLPKPRFDI